METDNERYRLYRRFIDESDSSSSFFDETDLIEIFDYATDLSEDGVRLKVLNYASRVFPDSIPMAERRALLSYDLGDSAEVRRILDLLPDTSVLGKILRLKIDMPTSEEMIIQLNNLLNKTNELEDEWLIQLIDFAADAGLYSWIIQNKDLIRSKISFPQTFLYEMVDIALENDDIPNAVLFAEELTLLDPFNVEFWEILSEIYTNSLSDLEKGNNAVDYALAINPDSLRALLQKARILSGMDGSFDEIMSYLDRAHTICPDLPEPVIAKALYNHYYGKDDIAAAILIDFLNQHPDNINVIEHIIRLYEEDADLNIFAPVFQGDKFHDEEEWMRMVLNNSWAGDNKLAVIMLKAYDKFVGLSGKSEYFEIFYKNGNYTDVINLYEKTRLAEDLLPSADDLVYILSKLRTNELTDLNELVKANKEKVANLLESKPTYISFSDRLELFSLYHYYSVINDLLMDNNLNDLDIIDPFSPIG